MEQGELAERVGSSQSQISQYETGAQYPRVATQERLAEALNVSPAAFYSPAWCGLDVGAGYGKRISRLRGGRSIKGLSVLAGIDCARWEAVEAEREELNPALAERLASAMGVSLMEVMEGQTGGVSRDLLDEFCLIPLYGVGVSAGDGALSEDASLARLALRREWIVRRGLDSDSLLAVRVEGDSMAPELGDGDMLIVDRSQAEVLVDTLYVLRLGAAVYCKRVQRLPGRRLLVSSINPAYPSFKIDPAAPPEDVCVIGRVVWACREL